MTDWYPRYPSLYRLDTLHLSLAEHGAYNLLIDWYMDERRPIPDDDRAIARILGVSADEWAGVSQNVRAFFKSRDGQLHHKRCDSELDAQDKRSTSRSEKARKAAEVRHRKIIDIDATSIDQAEDEQAPSTNRAQHEQGSSTSQASSKHAQGLLADATGQDKTVEDKEKNPPPTSNLEAARARGLVEAEFSDRFWPRYPVKEDRKNALKAFVNARKTVPLDDVLGGLERYIAKLEKPNAPKPKYAQGWLNGERWKDEAVPATQAPNGNGNGHVEYITDEFSSPSDRSDEARLIGWRSGKREWGEDIFGPEPGKPGCRVSERILRHHGYLPGETGP